LNNQNRIGKFGNWNRSPSSSSRSSYSEDASNRIFDGFSLVNGFQSKIKMKKYDPIFTMGSCFAREIEGSLIKMGGNVLSIDKSIDIPEFYGRDGRMRSGFFHRFTPWSMLLEFQQAFGKAEGWSHDSLLYTMGDDVHDLNYWDIGDSDNRAESVFIRRKTASELIKKCALADTVVLTLGLTESWYDLNFGFHANRVPPSVLARHKENFEFRRASVDDTLTCLHGIHEILKIYMKESFKIIITVSPVPLTRTFTDLDIVVANMESKSTLRVAASEFCRQVNNATYFPSYEMVVYSQPDLAYRPDRVHIESDMVRHIINNFIENYYEGDAFSSP